MEPASLYRDDSSVTPGIRLQTVTNFYSNHGHSGASGQFTVDQREGPASDSATSLKIEQMMSMMSSTQQLLLSQQEACRRLEDSVSKLRTEVAAIQQELSSGVDAKPESKGSRPKIPRELSVSICMATKLITVVRDIFAGKIFRL